MKRKIIIAGGTGALGSSIVQRLNDGATDFVILTRKRTEHHLENTRYVTWDATHLDSWVQELEGSAALINLVGKSVNCRYTAKNKGEIISSRVNATAVIGKAIQQSSRPPGVWINAGSAAIFGDEGDDIKDEDSPPGEGFLPEVCKKWEQAFWNAETPGTRKVFMRIGLVLQPGKGILKPFINLAKAGMGGKIGSGRQYITWIHEEDFSNLVKWIIDVEEDVEGILHAASPFPVTNKELMSGIRKTLRLPFGLPSPAFIVKIGASLIATEAELVLSGRRVISKVLRERKFQFKYPHLEDALNNLVSP